MLAFTLALALQAAAASGAPPPTVQTPTSAVPAALSPQAELVELERVYRESCDNRAYGSFDDVCTSLGDQITLFRRQMKRDAAQAAREARHPAKPTAPSPPPL